MSAEELVAVPDSGRVHAVEHVVGPAEVSPADRAHLYWIAHWLQNVALADLLDADPAGGTSWLVRRTRIAVEAWPRFRERLTLRTFCCAAAATLAERRTSISGDAGARIEATAVWIHVDSERLVPVRLGPDFEALYGETVAGRRARSKLRHPGPPDGAERHRWSFHNSDLDLAGHVNNASYWRIADQLLLDPDSPAPVDLEFEYRSPAGAGPTELALADGSAWVCDPDPERDVAASLVPVR